MAALFDVPGWSVPSAPISTQPHSKKRKRPDPDEQELLRSAQANLDRLIESLGGDEGHHSGREESLKNKKKKVKLGKATPQPHQNHREGDSRPSRKPSQAKAPARVADATPAANTDATSKKKAKKNNAKRRGIQSAMPQKKTSEPNEGMAGFTLLQQRMKDSLDGSRFRLLNEALYKSTSLEAVNMMKEDPKVFEDYHVGFRHQVQSWPSNPISHYISELESYPPRTVVADLGCGDAALARGLLPKNLVILSFDLVSDGAYVTEADICSRIPLPGSEPQNEDSTQGEAQIVDVVVCSLSLMSTNWPHCIREAWRILRPGGELKIAEVASRFASVNDFTSLICSIGFKLQKKDDRNSHFTLFKFKKVARAAMIKQEWSAIISQGHVLKPCEYKRR